jgi:hypothetical protein
MDQGSSRQPRSWQYYRRWRTRHRVRCPGAQATARHEPDRDPHDHGAAIRATAAEPAPYDEDDTGLLPLEHSRSGPLTALS